MTTVTTNLIQLTGSHVKKLKDMVKGHRHHKFIPVANFVKFEISSEQLTVTYVDTDKTMVQLSLAADGLENNIFLFPIDVLKKLSSTKSDVHEFIGMDDIVTHNENGIVQKHHVMNHQEFPKVNNNRDFNELATIDYNTIKQLSRANISTGKSETRPVLTTVLLKGNKMISTDSHRLYSGLINFELNEDVLIPTHIVKLIENLTDKGDSITLNKCGDLLKLTNQNLNIVYDGYAMNFPDTSRLIPQDFNSIIDIMEFDKFKKTLEAIKKSSKEKNVTTVMTFDKENYKITLSNREETIKSDICITEVNAHNQNFDTISFSASYLLDAIKQLESKQIRLKFTGALRPFIIEDSKWNGEQFALQLPVKIK